MYERDGFINGEIAVLVDKTKVWRNKKRALARLT
jgi:hypothetical protein